MLDKSCSETPQHRGLAESRFGGRWSCSSSLSALSLDMCGILFRDPVTISMKSHKVNEKDTMYTAPNRSGPVTSPEMKKFSFPYLRAQVLKSAAMAARGSVVICVALSKRTPSISNWEINKHEKCDIFSRTAGTCTAMLQSLPVTYRSRDIPILASDLAQKQTWRADVANRARHQRLRYRRTMDRQLVTFAVACIS